MQMLWPRGRAECLGCLDGGKGIVRIVVRDAVSGKYLVVPGTWTDDLNGAREFRTGPCAIDAISQMHGVGLEVVLTFGDPAYDVTLPGGPGTQRTKWSEAA